MSEIFYRMRSLEDAEQPAEDGKFRMLASTDDAVDFGGYREILSHAPGAVDCSAARSLLLNHKPDMLAGGISGMVPDGRVMNAEGNIDEDARMPSGVNVRKAVRNGILRGVSIGYNYSSQDTSYDEETRTLLVRKWRLLEISLTPIPADARAQVRSLPEQFVKPAAQLAATEKGDRSMSDDKKPQADTSALDKNESERAKAIADAREDASKAKARSVELVQIAKLAASHGLGHRAAEFLDEKKFANLDAAIEGIIAAKAEREAADPKINLGGASIRVGAETADKARDAAVNALVSRAGFKVEKDNPWGGRGILDIGRAYARTVGEKCDDWSKNDLAWYMLGQRDMIKGQRDAGSANVTTGQFTSFVFLNAITKAVAIGFEQGGSSINYQPLVSTQRVPDFKQYSIGSLGVSNLQNTLENVAFPELDKSEGVFNGTVKMWGGTIALTLQALVSDDTAQFERHLRMAGMLAQKTINKRVYQKLLMGSSIVEATSTWTSNTTSGGSLVYTTADLAAAARAKLGVVRAALMNKIGQDGNPLGTVPRYLVVPVTREVEAAGIVGASGPLLTAGATQPMIGGLQVVASPWLEASALTGNSTTSYYLIADPNEATGLMVSYINGMETPQVIPYDAGAVAAAKWKIFLPFECDNVFAANSAGTTISAAIQQGTT